MAPSDAFPGRGTPPQPDTEVLYLQHRGLLLYVALRKFNIPSDDAELLVQEAVLAYLTADTEIRNPRAWLVATVCNGSRAFWRRRVRAEHVEGTPLIEVDHLVDDAAADRIERTVLVQAVLAALRPDDRELLRLHYFEQLTAVEIAPLLGTTARYVVKRISIALRRAREAFTRLSNSQTPARASRRKES